MACGVYDPVISGLWNGEFDIAADTYKVILVDLADYTFSAAHEFLSSVPAAARVAEGTLANPAMVGRAFDADDITISGVTGDESEALIIYKDTGVEATSRLIYFSDTGTNLPFTPNGGDLAITWDAGASKIFAL